MEVRLNPLSTAVEGLKKNEENLTRAVSDLQRAQVENQNREAPAPAAEGDSVEVSDEALVADAVRSAVIPADDGGGDLTKPLVDIIQAKVAYQASMAAVKVTADVESEASKLIRRDA